jgi:hypothetical protein
MPPVRARHVEREDRDGELAALDQHSNGDVLTVVAASRSPARPALLGLPDVALAQAGGIEWLPRMTSSGSYSALTLRSRA